VVDGCVQPADEPAARFGHVDDVIAASAIAASRRFVPSGVTAYPSCDASGAICSGSSRSRANLKRVMLGTSCGHEIRLW
jgi:hypothetical protein